MSVPLRNLKNVLKGLSNFKTKSFFHKSRGSGTEYAGSTQFQRNKTEEAKTEG